MNLALIDILFDRVSKSKKLTSVDFIWHGGEPLLFGLSSFKKILANQKEKFKHKTIKIKNSIQTNGALINDEWAKLMKEEKIQLGVSIDGPKSLQDKQRKAMSGNSYDQVMYGMKKLNENKIPFGSLAVITKESINLGANVLFDFFVKNGIKTFDFLPQEPLFDEMGNQLTTNIYLTKEYVEFANNLFDIWFSHDDPDIHILLFEEIIKTILGRDSKICQIGSGICASTTFTLYPDGTLRLCDKFPRAYGNSESGVITKINEIDRIDDVVTINKYKILLSNQIESLFMCKNCKWYVQCKGACAFDRYMYANQLKLHSECSTYKIFEHVNSVIKNQLSE